MDSRSGDVHPVRECLYKKMAYSAAKFKCPGTVRQVSMAFVTTPLSAMRPERRKVDFDSVYARSVTIMTKSQCPAASGDERK